MEVIKKPDFSFGFGQKSPRDTGHMCQCSLWGQLRDGEERWEDGAEALPGGGRTESGRDLFLARRVLRPLLTHLTFGSKLFVPCVQISLRDAAEAHSEVARRHRAYGRPCSELIVVGDGAVMSTTAPSKTLPFPLKNIKLLT